MPSPPSLTGWWATFLVVSGRLLVASPKKAKKLVFVWVMVSQKVELHMAC
jgi:hypothetical protein